jgi:hypothetical protein
MTHPPTPPIVSLPHLSLSCLLAEGRERRTNPRALATEEKFVGFTAAPQRSQPDSIPGLLRHSKPGDAKTSAQRVAPVSHLTEPAQTSKAHYPNETLARIREASHQIRHHPSRSKRLLTGGISWTPSSRPSDSHEYAFNQKNHSTQPPPFRSEFAVPPLPTTSP